MATETFTVDGSWLCPAGVTSIQVECWGGGAAGFDGVAGVTGNIGGGGGAYSKTNAKVVTPGNTYNYIVATGGASSGLGGGDTSFDGGTLAKGGNASNGGAAGGGSGDTKFSGGAGSTSVTADNGGGGGGGAGSGGDGGAGSNRTGGTGTATGGGNGGTGGSDVDAPTAGSTKGGGGGGGGGEAGTLTAAAGARGEIIITYSASTRTADSNICIQAV